jgi:hypothetical protein
MALKNNGRLSRREMMQALSVCAAGGAAGMSPFLSGCREQVATPEQKEQWHGGAARKDGLTKPAKFLIVISASGGASIIDSAMAIRQSECATPNTLNVFPDASVTSIANSPLRAVKYSAGSLGAIPLPVNADQTPFMTKYKDNILVATCTGTSVNHIIAQKRSLTGNGAWNGRTMQEAMAAEYGADFPIPNVNMGTGGYIERGSDDSMPSYAYAEGVADAKLFQLGLDGSRGIKGAPDKELLAIARKVRNDKLDPESVFAQTFAKSDKLKRWYEQRGMPQQKLETMDLITKLNILPNMPPQIPLTEYGLGEAAEAPQLRGVFPNFFTDPFEGQAAAAFLLIKNRVSCAVTIGPNFNLVLFGTTLANPPLAFDYSHNDHRGAQAMMWGRILGVIDKLTTLLKAEPFDTATGETLWDRTLIYVATDFGRTKMRVSGATTFGSGHDLNNGFFMMSPMLKGNTVLGGVNPNTCMTYGFDTETGAPDPAKVLSNERDIYAGVLHTLSVTTTGSGLPDAKAFRKVI